MQACRAIRALILSVAVPALGPSALVLGQTVIENPANPASGNPERIVELKEVLRITDESGEFFFKSPSIQVGPGGSVFVNDEQQILKFDSKGRFLRNYFHKGQGPGEVTSLSGFFPLPSGLMVHGINPPKMMRLAEDGSLVRESTLRSSLGSLRALGMSGDSYVFIASENPAAIRPGTGSGVVVVRSHVFAWSEGQAAPDDKGSFPGEVFVIKIPGGGVASIWKSPRIAVPWGRGRLAVVHEEAYSIKVLDLASKAVVRVFRRPYERVKRKEPQRSLCVNGVQYDLPPQKHEWDIEALSAVGGDLWVVTSTRDKDGNPLVDVFDDRGVYKDRFYVRRPAEAGRFFLQFSATAAIRDGCLYQVCDVEDSRSIIKYEIRDTGAPGRGK